MIADAFSEQILSTKPIELDNLYPFNAFRHELALQLDYFLQESEPLEGVSFEEVV